MFWRSGFSVCSRYFYLRTGLGVVQREDARVRKQAITTTVAAGAGYDPGMSRACKWGEGSGELVFEPMHEIRTSTIRNFDGTQSGIANLLFLWRQTPWGVTGHQADIGQ